MISNSLLKLDQATDHCDARDVTQGEVRSMPGNQEAIQRCQARLIDEQTRLFGQTGISTNSDRGLMPGTHPKAAMKRIGLLLKPMIKVQRVP